MISIGLLSFFFGVAAVIMIVVLLKILSIGLLFVSFFTRLVVTATLCPALVDGSEFGSGWSGGIVIGSARDGMEHRCDRLRASFCSSRVLYSG